MPWTSTQARTSRVISYSPCPVVSTRSWWSLWRMILSLSGDRAIEQAAEMLEVERLGRIEQRCRGDRLARAGRELDPVAPETPGARD